MTVGWLKYRDIKNRSNRLDVGQKKQYPAWLLSHHETRDEVLQRAGEQNRCWAQIVSAHEAAELWLS